MSSNKSVVAKKTTVSKKTVAKEPVAEVIVPEVQTEVVQPPVESSEDTIVEDSQSKRGAPTRDNVLQSFDEIIKSIETEMETLREGDTKNRGVKFLRTLNKRIKVLKNQSSRIIKDKRVSAKKGTNNNSGFFEACKDFN